MQQTTQISGSVATQQARQQSLTTEPERNLSAAQIDAQEQEYKRDEEQLSDLRVEAGKYEAKLSGLGVQQSDAQRLLDLSANIGGFKWERETANAELVRCARLQPKLQGMLDGCRSRIQQLEETLKRTDTSLFGKTNEIRKLARKLQHPSSPPVRG